MQLHRTLPNHITNQLQSYQSKDSKMLSLTQKGLNQAHRNDSTEIWKVIHYFQQQTQASSFNQSIQYDHIDQTEDKSFKRSPKQMEEQKTHKQNNHQFSQKVSQNQEKPTNQKDSSNKISKAKTKQKANTKNNKKQQKSLNLEQQSHHQSENQYLKKMNNQIVKHLQQERFNSRNLSNSAFAKLYNRPCIQSYGYGNVSKESQASNNLLKTHNITPHTISNNPSTYQTYKNAIKYSKRTKINDEDKQQRIRRQFLRWFDDSIVSAAQIQLNKKNQEKRAKSQENLQNRLQYNQSFREESEESLKEKKMKKKSLKELLGSNQPAFIYKYKDSEGQVRFSKDRHGVNCYVDSSFSANDKALINFKKSENPIYPEKIQQQDMNLDLIRKQNYQKSIEQGHPGHYLVPYVVTPYDKAKYQLKRRRAESTVN